VDWVDPKAPLFYGKAAAVQANHLYTITNQDLAVVRYTNQGFVTGVLSVPFKMHLSDHSVSAGSTVGGYVGYQTSLFNSITVTPVIAGGLALIQTQDVNSSSQSNRAGVSLATGIIGNVGPHGSGVQLGILLGVDYLGKSADYKYEGKPWLAFEVGYSFGQ
jgi:hypothetical protein